MSSFEVYTAIIQQKVYIESVEKRFRERQAKLQENLSRAVGHYMIGITYQLPVRTILSVQLMTECKDSIEKIDKVLEVLAEDKNNLQKIIDNHFDEKAFDEYIANFGKTVSKIDEIMRSIDQNE